VHGLRLLKALNSKNVVVGIDFSNAFNTVERSVIAKEVADKFPQVYSWFDLCYGSPSTLLVKGRDSIKSERGVQQGDPLGPFFFALALQPALAEAANQGCSVMAYLDDVHLCGEVQAVEKAIKVLLKGAAEIGLSCNRDKCWATAPVKMGKQRLTIPDHPSVLGVPLDISEPLPQSLTPTNLLNEIASLPDLQLALHLLRYVHNSRLTYHLRLSSPDAYEDIVHDMMQKTKKALASLLKLEDIPEAAWQQALLHQGPGLGLTNLVVMAPYMSYASLLEAVGRLSAMDPNTFGPLSSTSGWSNVRDFALFSLFRAAMNVRISVKGADNQLAKLQHLFAVDVVAPQVLDQFLASPNIPDVAKAIVKSTDKSPLAKQFLHAVPTQKGLSLSSLEMKISLCLLLGIELEMSADVCMGCPKRSTHLTQYHALSCKWYGGLIHRHDLVKAVIGDICKHAQTFYQLEPKHLFGQDKTRPDVVIHFGNNGHDIAYDLTIVSPVRDLAAIRCTLKDEQAFLATEEKVKADKYSEKCAESGTAFCPIVLSAFGGILQSSYSMGIQPIISRIRKTQFHAPNWAAPDRKSYWLQRMAIALWTGNVAKVKPFLNTGRLVQH